jgi:Lrp/AsnC family leucine-responsive transcriptional regulator
MPNFVRFPRPISGSAKQSEESYALDDRDRRILTALSRNARMSYRDLARVANLSANATAERIQRLQTAGVIRGFSADISAAALGLSLSAYVDVKLRPGTSMEAFEGALVKIEGIRDAASLTGTFDARLLVNVENPARLGELIEMLRKSAGVMETSSTVICRPLKIDTK